MYRIVIADSMSFLFYESIRMIRDGVRSLEAIEKKRRRTQVPRGRAGELVEALPRTILREDLLLKNRSRFDCTIDSSPGFKRRKEEVAEWRRAPLFFSFSFVFFLSFRNVSIRSRESPL